MLFLTRDSINRGHLINMDMDNHGQQGLPGLPLQFYYCQYPRWSQFEGQTKTIKDKQNSFVVLQSRSGNVNRHLTSFVILLACTLLHELSFNVIKHNDDKDGLSIGLRDYHTK